MYWKKRGNVISSEKWNYCLFTQEAKNIEQVESSPDHLRFSKREKCNRPHDDVLFEELIHDSLQWVAPLKTCTLQPTLKYYCKKNATYVMYCKS